MKNNIMLRSKWGIMVSVITLILVACGKHREEVAEREKLPRVKDDELIASLDSLANFHFGSFFAKISTKYDDSTSSASFKTSVRIIEDSMANALITYAKIPIFNTLVTKDSLKISNKREKCYELESLAYIKEAFGVDFSFRNLEELFLGMPLGYDAESKYFRVRDPYTYTLSSHRKKQAHRAERQGEDEYIVFYELSADRKDLLSTTIESPADTTSIRIEYRKRMLVGAYRVPEEMYVEIRTPRKTLLIEMNYNKAEIGEGEEIYFVIPEGYEKCND